MSMDRLEGEELEAYQARMYAYARDRRKREVLGSREYRFWTNDMHYWQYLREGNREMALECIR